LGHVGKIQWDIYIYKRFKWKATEFSLGFVEEVIKEMRNIPSKFPTINVD